MRKIKQTPTAVPHLRPEADNDEVLFSFRYLHNVSFTSDKIKPSFFSDLLLRLNKLSQLGWRKIASDKRHGYGWEKIRIDQIKPAIKETPTPDADNLLAFRASGDNRAFLGVRTANVFHILFLEAKFGDVYKH